jgi:glycosyltransferase involved in cell wall biosynthesis
LNIVKAMSLLPKSVDIPLVVIGDGDDYKNQVKEFINKNHLNKRIIFLSERSSAKTDHDFRQPATLAAIYQMATAMIYPSFFEGFGLPVLEALWSKTPVITSNVSCLPETGGDAAYYVDPSSAEQIAEGMQKIFEDQGLRIDMIAKGSKHAENFTLEKCTASVMQVYKKITGV